MRNILMVGGLTLIAGAVAFAVDGGKATGQSSKAATNSGQAVLVELFTSQGCSSCPPADRVLERIDGEGGVVAISRPVTYWDRLGWKDTLARPANDLRQRAYAARGLPGGGVFTPETVVQGISATVGSREGAVREMIADARTKNPVALIEKAGRITASRAVAGTELNFLAIASSRTVKIGSGENGRRQISYTNIVLDEVAVACTAGSPCSATIPANIAGRRGADRWAVVLQEKGHGRVQAVRWISRAAK